VTNGSWILATTPGLIREMESSIGICVRTPPKDSV